MKAKVKETGEIVDVYHEPQHGQITNIYKESVFVNGRIWTEDELEFIESKEVNVDKSEDYKRGYQDALANIKNEIEQRIAEKEKFLEEFPLEDYVSSVASSENNKKVGLIIAKMIIDKHIEA